MFWNAISIFFLKVNEMTCLFPSLKTEQQEENKLVNFKALPCTSSSMWFRETKINYPPVN